MGGESENMAIINAPQVSALAEALKGFTPIEECKYGSKHLGKSGQDELMACECRQQVDENGNNLACSEESDCINRLTFIECTNSRAHSCGQDCQNQRFQKRQYASVDVIKTEKKGFGLCASKNVAHGTFIYEYVGDVIDEGVFQKRIKTYEERGIKHFYFMMLQKGEFIDATMKGNLARFCNHSCNPNAYVDKWVVGDRLRMGIFAKRDIQQGEEITFDYNVDRYGANPQKCYCGEKNCVGVLGGKIQTESAFIRIPSIIMDALDLTEEEEKTWLAWFRKAHKGAKPPPPEDLQLEYSEQLPCKQVSAENVPKLMGVLMKSKEEWLVEKCVERIYISGVENNSESGADMVEFGVMKMHGYEIFSRVLREWMGWANHTQRFASMVLSIMNKFPMKTKNKISSSQIETTVKELASECEFEQVKDQARELLQLWGSLQMAYRIPRREKQSDSEPSAEPPNSSSEPQSNNTTNDSESQRRAREEKRRREQRIRKDRELERERERERAKELPPGWETAKSPDGRVYYYHRERNKSVWVKPTYESDARMRQEEEEKERKDRLQKIIAEAQQRPVESTTTTPGSREDSPGDSKAEAKLRSMFAKIVPNFVAKYEKEIGGHDKVKKYSKEIVHILVDKELRKGKEVSSELGDEKRAKIKQFVKAYMHKVIAHKSKKTEPETNGKTREGRRESKTRRGSESKGESKRIRVE